MDLDLPDLPDSQLAISAGFEMDNGWAGDATLYSYGNTCSVADCTSGTEVDSYSVIDVSLSKEISEKVDIYLVIENITDEEDIVARAPKNGARAQKPTTTTIGVRYQF